MTRRQNFLAALRRQPHDHLPAAFVIDNMNYPGGFPLAIFDVEKCFDFEHSIGFQRRLGLDVLYRGCPAGLKEIATDRYWRNDPKGGRICETPIGVLHAEAQAVPGAPMLRGGRETILKKPEDYDTLTWLFEQQRYEVASKDVELCRKNMEWLGEDGVVYVNPPCSPLMDIVRNYAGIEEFVYTVCDYPERVERLLGIMADRYCEQYELIGQITPAQVLTFWDDATTKLLSHDLFARFEAPVLKRFADAAHKHGKILVNHTCGAIRGFADLYDDANQDAVDWLAVPPTGDMTVKLAQEIWKCRVVPMAAPDPNIVRNAAPETVRDHIVHMLDGADLNNVIVLLPCPQGTAIATAKIMCQTLAQQFGTRFDSDLL